MSKSRAKKRGFWIVPLVLIVAGIALVGVWYYVNKTGQAKTSLADFILAHPKSAAVVAYTFDDDGTFVEDEYAVFYNADEPLVMASTMKIVVLAAFADAVANGELDPNERVSVTDWEKYYLPMTDGGAHVMGLRSLGLKADADGFALDHTAMVSLDELARIMIHYSGNAATDYLLARLGASKMASVMSKLDLNHHTPVVPTLGIALAIFNHENTPFDAGQLQSTITAVSKGDNSDLDRLVELYLHDPNWRAAQIEFMMSENETDDVSEQEMWAYQVEASQLFPKSTARDYARLMALTASGRLLSVEASAIVQRKLENVPSDWPLRLLFYDRFGAKDGITAGVLTLASYAIPKRGLLSGQSRVVVILTNQQPLEIWPAQVQYQGHYVLQIDLARASGIFGKFEDSN